MRVPHWAQYGGPFGEGWKWGLGHRAGGFYLVEIGPLRLGRHFR